MGLRAHHLPDLLNMLRNKKTIREGGSRREFESSPGSILVLGPNGAGSILADEVGKSLEMVVFFESFF